MVVPSAPACTRPLSGHKPVTTDLDATFAALADPTRRAVVGLLREGPRRPSELAEALSLSRPAVSRHLKVLRDAKLVAEQTQASDARKRVYRLQPERFQRLRGWADEVTALWTDQLDAFRRHAEARARAVAASSATGHRATVAPSEPASPRRGHEKSRR